MEGRKAPTVIAALLSGIVAFSACGSPAVAQGSKFTVYGESEAAREAMRVEHVKIGSLDLTTRAGANRLHSRVGSAVKRVCLFEPEIRLQPSDYSPCASSAWNDARPQIARAIAKAQALAQAGLPASTAATISVSAASR